MKAAKATSGFMAGFLGVLVFHQTAILLLHLLGIIPSVPWRLDPVPPLGVPTVISAAFWGGLWGIVLAFILPNDHRSPRFWLLAFVFGALAPTLVSWFIVQPLKGQPMGGGFQWPRLLIGPFVNGAWGLGTATVLALWPGRQVVEQQRF
jgi:hypothetical protein